MSSADHYHPANYKGHVITLCTDREAEEADCDDIWFCDIDGDQGIGFPLCPSTWAAWATAKALIDEIESQKARRQGL